MPTSGVICPTSDLLLRQREEQADFRQVQHANRDLTGNIAVEQPIPVLAEHGSSAESPTNQRNSKL